MAHEVFEIKNGKIIITKIGETATGTTYPASHMAMGIREARADLASLEAKGTLGEAAIARRNVLREAVSAWAAK